MRYNFSTIYTNVLSWLWALVLGQNLLQVLGRRDVGGLVGVAGYRVFTGAHVGGTPAAQRLGEAARPLHRRLLSLRTIRSRVGHRARGHAGRQACPRPYQRLPHRPQELPASHVVERHSEIFLSLKTRTAVEEPHVLTGSPRVRICRKLII
ncbi:unnamed protein product [Nesidiocoris tenuis]|uniref:Secreted protein n=1 Tax=Nesidiocoris tenuis TaxID=355587 RepID=A0A6H5FWE1_9HEMI|nr:unnamed protein product [Nesidiocoris tenuis]